jgi:hypothetical protein
MIRLATASAAFLAALSGSALAAYTIPPGEYAVTTQIQNIQNDTAGICSSILKIGEVQLGVGHVLGLGKTSQVVTPVPTATSPYTLGTQVCNYSALPATLNANGTTPITGTVTCNLNGTTYVLTTTSGNGNIVNVASTTNDAFFLNAKSTVSVGGTTICTITTSSLNIFSGKAH